MAILIPTFIYFVFLTWCLLKHRKVIVKRPLCAVLFSFVYMVTICGLVCKAIAMTISYHTTAYKVQTYSFVTGLCYCTVCKVLALLLRGFILVSEISVVTFGLFFSQCKLLTCVHIINFVYLEGFYGRSKIGLLVTVVVIIVIGISFTTTEVWHCTFNHNMLCIVIMIRRGC